ncbi:DUF2218 domain-containing protein [Psychromonas sp. B3M02]|uniref:DUF2218 domain-containing protein n=1 Tax=unclassified Psychromonas TaxID=2614957 RepID=UPI000DEB6FB2|nr:DUF2218 domain-containing protein [Psychromonas sp. B3M02]RBW43433.1 DUF2218 domain-containing protein [Psychromonas sp. B3M02]
MHNSKTLIKSEHAGRYLQTLCKHFSRKVPAEWDQQAGKVNFAMGECKLTYLKEANALALYCSADSQDKLSTIQRILEQHVTMLSRRETISMVWSNT